MYIALLVNWYRISFPLRADIALEAYTRKLCTHSEKSALQFMFEYTEIYIYTQSLCVVVPLPIDLFSHVATAAAAAASQPDAKQRVATNVHGMRAVRYIDNNVA